MQENQEQGESRYCNREWKSIKKESKNTQEYFRSRCFRQQFFKPLRIVKLNQRQTTAIWLIAEWRKKELNLALAVLQPCWTKQWLLQVWACRDEDWYGSQTRLSQTGHVSTGPWCWPCRFLHRTARRVTLSWLIFPPLLFPYCESGPVWGGHRGLMVLLKVTPTTSEVEWRS